MSYERTYWSNGDVITDENLNKIEEELEDLAGSRIRWIDFEYDSDKDRYFCHDFYAMGLFNDLTLTQGTAFYAARFDGRIYTVSSCKHHHDDTINKDVYRIAFNSVYHSTDDESGNPVVVSDEFYTSTVYDDEIHDMEGQTITREVLTIAPVTK